MGQGEVVGSSLERHLLPGTSLRWQTRKPPGLCLRIKLSTLRTVRKAEDRLNVEKLKNPPTSMIYKQTLEELQETLDDNNNLDNEELCQKGKEIIKEGAKEILGIK